jgi:hypothetical protein
MSELQHEPSCPKCGAAMVRRVRGIDRAPFWGCSRFPACRGTTEIATVGMPQPVVSTESGTTPPVETEDSAQTSVAGGSARTEFERRRALDKEKLRKRRPIILAVGSTVVAVFLLLAVFDQAPAGPLGQFYRPIYLFFALLAAGAMPVAMIWLPDSTIAWLTGAEGEERTGKLLRPLEGQGFRVINDRLIPHSQANIDHVVVGPPGVFVIETKNYAGRVKIHDDEVWVAGHRRTEIVAQAKREAAAVAAVVAPTAVTPLLCVHRAELGWFKMEPGGVRIVGPREMVKFLRKAPAKLSPDEVNRLADRIDRSLAPAVGGAGSPIAGE